jgi:CheY-like chemotaxis protein
MPASLLVVDDEPPIRAVLEQTLETAGYDVVLASDGAQAIKEIERRGVDLRGLLVDLKLGKGPDGWEVARLARALNPAALIVYITGGRGQDCAPPWAPKGVLLLKPFTPEQVLLVMKSLVPIPT